MAYVKLPKELGVFAARKTGGRIDQFEFSMFAGEACPSGEGGEADHADPSKSGPGGAKTALALQSPKARKRFELRGLPDDLLQPGEAAAVIAVLPRKADHGPIVAVANLDADERVDFRWREGELLRLLTGERVDRRKPGARRRAQAWAVVKGLGVGALAYGAMALYYDVQAFETPARFAAAFGAALRPETVLAALGLAIGATVYFSVEHAKDVAEKARRQQQALDALWARVGHAFGYAADRRDALRAEDQSAPRLAGPLLKPSRLLPSPEQARKARQDARAGADDDRADPVMAAREREARGRAVRGLDQVARRWADEGRRRSERAPGTPGDPAASAGWRPAREAAARRAEADDADRSSRERLAAAKAATPEEPSVEAPRRAPRAAEPTVQAPRRAPRATEPTVQAPRRAPRAAEPTIQAPRRAPRAAEPTVQPPRRAPRAAGAKVQAPRRAPQAAEPNVQAPRRAHRAAEPNIQTPRKTPSHPAQAARRATAAEISQDGGRREPAIAGAAIAAQRRTPSFLEPGFSADLAARPVGPERGGRRTP